MREDSSVTGFKLQVRVLMVSKLMSVSSIHRDICSYGNNYLCPSTYMNGQDVIFLPDSKRAVVASH